MAAAEHYDWKRLQAESETIEETLNGISEEWEVFQILPTLTFEKTKVVMATVPLPGQVVYDIILRRTKNK